ncbi:MAG TPA: hypothetical protein VGI45_11440 [Terracidiphilus sp.]|jgi:hypothetical protein
MEFTYKLTEDDYARAARVKVKSSGSRPWLKLLSRLQLAFFFVGLWIALIAGRILERFEISGEKLGNIAAGRLMLSSVLPTLILSWLIILAFQMATYWPKRKVRREQYRRNEGCHVATSVAVSPESIAFRSETGSSQSKWTCYTGWEIQDGILILLKQGGVRQILKVEGLDPNQQSELKGILANAILKT